MEFCTLNGIRLDTVRNVLVLDDETDTEDDPLMKNIHQCVLFTTI